MKSIQNQVWLTFALTDSDVPKALTLCFSLRKVFTAYKLGIIVSPKVSVELREAVSSAFEFVFALDLDRNTAGLKDEEFVKVFSLTLTGFKSCVMLSPNMLAIKNADELLEKDGSLSERVVCSADDATAPIFKIRPCDLIFKRLMRQRNGISAFQYLKSWDREKVGKVIPDKYNRMFNFKCGMLLGNENDISIVNLTGNPDAELNSTFFGVVGQRVTDLWQSLQQESVLPLLESLRNPQNPRVEIGEHSIINGEGIAIIGMSCRYPGANSLDEFWKILAAGEDATGNPPPFRWLKEQCVLNNKPECRNTNAGFLKDAVDDFDAKFFNISPKEMVAMDPQHRLLHELVWEGLEDAAINPHSLESTNAGVFIGSWLNDYKDILTQGGTNEFYRMYMGNSIGAGAARISHLLGLTGPSIATESGCSSAMVAVHLACKSLERRETSVALACGVNLLLRPFDKDTMPIVLSADGHCKTFDAKADGFARAEGCGVLVLKRIGDAVRDGDKIRALIKGSGMSQEGVSKSMGTPTVQCESLAMKAALDDAGVNPADVTYVEAHGTGTVVGDPLEVAAIAAAYHSSQRVEPLLIGSVKTNVGHTESCSGITGIMKVVLALEHESIPPHRNFETLNPAIDLGAVPATIPLEAVPWPRKTESRRLAGVSSFGITGTDAHAIIEEAPTFPAGALTIGTLERPLHLLKISAKTEEALKILVESYSTHLATSSEQLSDLAFTGNVGRAEFSHRAVVIAKTTEDASGRLEQNKILKGEAAPETLGKVCFLFTGQGSQYPGMGKQLYETSPVFRMHFEYCEQLLKSNYNIDIAQVLWSGVANSAEVSRTIYSQTSIFCLEYALLKLWESWGLKPDYVVGHSLGEFAAAVCAGILSVEDALKLVAERSRLIDQLPRGKMLVIKAEQKKVGMLMSQFTAGDSTKILDYAALNSAEQTVVAGDSGVVLDFGQFCKEKHLKCIVLEASHAFHSKHMDPMLDDYRMVANTVKNLEGNDSKYISGMRGATVEAEQVDAEYWVEHTREKVRFMNASKKAVELGCKTFIEIGPQPILSALTMMNNEEALTCLPSLKRTDGEWETLLNTLGKLYVKGLQIDWKGFEQFYNREKVSLPHYPFCGKKFWPDVLSSSAGVSLHPLLGSILPNPSSLKLFQSDLSLQNLEYVKDHAIGDNVIFPGAAFLEMCLAAGLATIECSTQSLSAPTRPMKIENLSIQAPLCLQEATSTQLQTVVKHNTESGGDWNDINIKIYRKAQSCDSDKWQLHANATFCPLPSQEDKEEFTAELGELEATVETPCEDPALLEQVYDKLASVGLKFGPVFRSISQLWRVETSNSLLAKVRLPPDSGSQGKYILHPAVLDAMIQAIMMLRPLSTMKKTLYVPIQVGKFVWLSEASPCSELYIRAQERGHTASAMLMDSTGAVLAGMSSVELIETTVKTIESVLEEQNSVLPNLWEETWRKLPHHTEYLAENLEKLSQTKFYTEEFHTEFERQFNNPAQERKQIFQNVEQLGYLNYIRSFQELGWKPELGNIFGESSLFSELQIQPQFRKYFGFICDVFEEEGILQKVSENEWKVVKIPPSIEKAEALLTSATLSSTLCEQWLPTRLYQEVGSHLTNVFRGETNPLSILFPEGPKTYPDLSEFYSHFGHCFHISEFNFISQLMVNYFMEVSIPGITLKILECGAGTGSYSEYVLDVFGRSENIQFEYTYTDISAAFFPAAEKRFEKQLPNLVFKKLNLEEDPIAQGFTPGYFDLVFATEVIHATRDIGEALRNIRLLMKPYGKLVIQESTRVNRVVAFLFGALEGYWRFTDLELRAKFCTLDKPTWQQVLCSNGFEIDGIFSVFEDRSSMIVAQKTLAPPRVLQEGKSWLVFHNLEEPLSGSLIGKIEQVGGRSVIRVTSGERLEQEGNSFTLRKTEISDFSQLFASLHNSGVELEGILYCWALGTSGESPEELLHPYFNLSKTLLNLSLKVNPRLVLLTCGVVPFEDNDLSSFGASALWGFSKSMKNEAFHLDSRCIDISDGELDGTPLRLSQLFQQIWSNDKENQLALYGGFRYIPKFQSHKPLLNALKLPPGSNRFQLVLPATNSISDLEFGPLDLSPLKEDEVEVQIKASALNFRDVLSVIKPTAQFKDCNAVGFDFGGVVKRVGEQVTKWQVGDLVCGCNVHFSAMPSHVTLNEEHLLHLPENTTLCEAATIPAVYITSVVCLLETAKISSQDVVLIHTATGGVGLSAIQICKHVGATIIATAGSRRKQNYLRSVGISHVFHSRNTKYGEQILKLTGGRGVDVVLNSLTSEGFKEATLQACAKGARFVEMSKLNIWEKEQVAKLRPDVKYTVIDVSSADAQEWTRFMGILRGLIEKGVVKPIPYVSFDGLHIRQALQHMQRAKHIGKIVCVMPELRHENGKVVPFIPMFNERSSYLITGGLGGIGFEVCKWILKMGGKHVVLASRTPPSYALQKRIEEMNCGGANVIPVSVDVGNFSQLEELLKNQMAQLRLPPLKGVMHAAGTLADGFIINQEWPKLSSTFATKIRGSLNLHELTKELHLEHFILFSSIAALFGSPGQSNHVAGNAFEDALAHYRHSIGLPATTVNWGQWGEVGIAKEIDVAGVKSISTLQGLAALEYVMKAQRTHTTALNMESFVILSKVAPQVGNYLDERLWKDSVGAIGDSFIKSDDFWRQYDSLPSLEDKLALLKLQLQSITRSVLKLDSVEEVGGDMNLQEMGVDSLMFVEIRNSLQILMGDRLVVNAGAIKDCNTVNLLATTLVNLIEGKEEEENQRPPTAEEVNQLILEDCQLPKEIGVKVGQEAKTIRQVSRVFLTGVTGLLGPYILKELVSLPQISEVVCLIRPRKTESVEDRLRKALEGKALSLDDNMNKIRCVSGNVAEPHLGLEPNIWEELSQNMDAVFNCAASVLHTEHYRKRASAQDMRAVNVGGIRNILEFATENRLKLIYHASSLLAVATVDEDGKISERWPELGEYDNVTTFGYPVSKYVGDMLMKEGASRGVPTKIFRFPLIVGERETGRCTLENNHALLRFMFIMKNGVIPSTPQPWPTLPVDDCARVSIQLFFDERATSIQVFNVTPAQPDTDQEFVGVAARFGHKVDFVEFSEFTKRIQEAGEKEGEALGLFKDFYSEESNVMNVFTSAPILRKWLEGGDEARELWRSSNVVNLIPDYFDMQEGAMDYFYRDLSFCKSQGWFTKFGL